MAIPMAIKAHFYQNRPALIFLLLVLKSPMFAEYPEILNLGRADILFNQLQNDIETFYRASALRQKHAMPKLTLFRYRRKKGEDLLAISARLNLPYEALATINRADHTAAFAQRDIIIVPNMPGVFIPLLPQSDLELMLFSTRSGTDAAATITVDTGNGKSTFLFYPGGHFHPVERAFFLKILFRFPLAEWRITSQFGLRSDPFSGHARYHNGVDLAAPSGTNVLAARDGIIFKIGYDDTYGNHIVVNHSGGYQTLYGHLEEIHMSLNQSVNSGMIIGTLGSTGRTTGPHLHFEILKSGRPKDPVPLLPTF